MEAMKSSDFLLQVSSSAAGDGGVVAVSGLEADDALEMYHSIDRRSSSARPWWVALSDTEDGEIGDSNMDTLKGDNDALQFLSFAKKRAVAATFIFLGRAPILSAALIVAIIAGGFSQGDVSS